MKELTNKQEDDLLEAGREPRWLFEDDDLCETCGVKLAIPETNPKQCEDCI